MHDKQGESQNISKWRGVAQSLFRSEKSMPDMLEFVAAIIMLVSVKTFLIKDLLLTVNGTAELDDKLYIDQANSLIHGSWLGPYWHHTLVKSPFYSMWIAASWQARVPLWLSQHLLHLFACAIMLLAIRPWVKSAWIRVLLFAVLLFDPRTFGDQAMRIVREGVYCSLSLLVIACLLGLLSTSDKRSKYWPLWPLGLGLSSGAMWLTREEGIWLLPSILLVLGYWAASEWNRGTFQLPRFMVTIVLSLGILLGSISLVSGLNYKYYGVYCVVEVKASPYKEAYGALTRVSHSNFQRFNSVPKETRERIYKVSPLFLELRPYLEGYPGTDWGTAGAFLVDPPDRKEIAGSWFIWALRDAVYLAGYHRTAPEAAEYYRALATEVNDACDDGRLEAGPERVSNVLPWRWDYLSPIAENLIQGGKSLVTLSRISSTNGVSFGTDSDIELFESITRWRAAPRYAVVLEQKYNPNPNTMQLGVLNTVTSGYRFITPFAFVLGISLWILGAFVELRKLRLSPIFIFNTALIGAVLSRLLILAYLATTSFWATNELYMAPLYSFVYIIPITTMLGIVLTFSKSDKDVEKKEE
ncbi:MAG: hypothetical protein VCD00_16715 [Candidatus Hydrogenedentota bacterium]